MNMDFNSIYQEEYTRLFGRAYQMLQHVQDAEDAVQDAFIRVLTTQSQLNTSRQPNIHAYFYTIVTRICIDRIRQRNVRRINIPLDDELEHIQVDTLDEAEAWAYVQPVLDRISRQQVAVLKLYYHAGHSRVDAAAITHDPKFPNKIRGAHVAARKYRHLLEV